MAILDGNTIDRWVAEYIEAVREGIWEPQISYPSQEPEPWEQETLHLSDLGSCARKTMLRLSGATPRPISIDYQSVTEEMFDLAHYIHHRMYNAFIYKDVLLTHEWPLLALPEGWSGRLDGVLELDGVMYIIDVKSQHPNAQRFNKSLPKQHHVRQITGYQIFYELENPSTNIAADFGSPILIYTDRGGQNPTVTCGLDDLPRSDVMMAIAGLNEWRSALPELPPFKEPDLVFINRKTELLYGPDWECSEAYCPYFGTTCVPPDGDIVAEKKGSRYIITSAGRRCGIEKLQRLAAERADINLVES